MSLRGGARPSYGASARVRPSASAQVTNMEQSTLQAMEAMAARISFLEGECRELRQTVGGGGGGSGGGDMSRQLVREVEQELEEFRRSAVAPWSWSCRTCARTSWGPCGAT